MRLLHLLALQPLVLTDIPTNILPNILTMIVTIGLNVNVVKIRAKLRTSLPTVNANVALKRKMRVAMGLHIPTNTASITLTPLNTGKNVLAVIKKKLRNTLLLTVFVLAVIRKKRRAVDKPQVLQVIPIPQARQSILISMIE